MLTLKRFQANPTASPEDALEWLEACDYRITEDPAEGLVYARVAVRMTRKLGIPCLHVRSVGTLAAAWRFLGDLERSERVFHSALTMSHGCRCIFCGAGLFRKFSLLRRSQGRYEEALAAASKSLDCAFLEFEKGKTLLVRGKIFGDLGNVARALWDIRQAISCTPAKETRFLDFAQQSYAVFLLRSKDPVHFDEAARDLPEIRKRLTGLKRAPLIRAKLGWLEGSVYAHQAEIKPGLTGHQRYGLRCKAAHHLRGAVKRLCKTRTPLSLNACAADLAAVEYNISRERLEEALATPSAPELAVLWSAVRRAVREPEPVFWAALEALRAATVERGCTPPLVPYGLATGW